MKSQPTRTALFNDPVHGFISVPEGPLTRIIDTPVFQRLRRIRQLGLGFLVFPGAVHTRFEHALGAMTLMQEALTTIRKKGTDLSPEEVEAALVAALLHDIGHGPFSHTLEHQLVQDDADGTPFHHETMSRALILRLEDAIGDALERTIHIFDDTYEKPFLHELVASQLDMDRLDYLRRDAFYTGVAEGVVGVQRVLKTLRVQEGRLAIEAKGAYAVENVLLSRRLMFWQVYLHKTVLAADHLLRAIVTRARSVWDRNDAALAATADPLALFLQETVTASDALRPDVVDAFAALDDTDILAAIKRWQGARDPILADLSKRFLTRSLPRTLFLETNEVPDAAQAWTTRTAEWLVEQELSSAERAEEDAGYYVGTDIARHAGYQGGKRTIEVIDRRNALRELPEVSDTVKALRVEVERPYICVPKEVEAKD